MWIHKKYKLGEWIIDDSSDLDQFFERLEKIQRSAAQILNFPQDTGTSTAPSGGTHAKIIPFKRPQRLLQSEYDKIREAYLRQRRQMNEKIRQGKIERFNKIIEELESTDLSVERKCRLNLLKEDFEEHLGDAGAYQSAPIINGWDKAERTRAKIEELEAQDVSIEFEVRLDMLKNEFEDRLRCIEGGGYDPELEDNE